MEAIKHILDLFLHVDKHLLELVQTYGTWVYGILFGIVFMETGLVVTPFLPGDSLLFAVGALAASPGSPLQVVPLCVLLVVAAVLGDAVNYSIGKRVGPAIFERESSRFLKRDHLLKAQAFYLRHGGKTIILARFVPIVRTFAPFVAGIGRMPYRRFAMFNIVGGVVWVVLFVAAGYAFGNVPAIKRNFHYVIVGIIVVSMLPGVIEYLRARAASKAARTRT